MIEPMQTFYTNCLVTLDMVVIWRWTTCELSRGESCNNVQYMYLYVCMGVWLCNSTEVVRV
jgi:hypothetical protein